VLENFSSTLISIVAYTFIVTDDSVTAKDVVNGLLFKIF
jgi:hypothetical protein